MFTVRFVVNCSSSIKELIRSIIVRKVMNVVTPTQNTKLAEMNRKKTIESKERATLSSKVYPEFQSPNIIVIITISPPF